MVLNCPTCGKRFVAHWPELWPFREGNRYYCRQACKNSDDERFKRRIKTETSMKKGRPKGMGRCKITLEDKKKAVQIAIDGGDPLEYLRGLRSKNPAAMWYAIRENLKKADPATYEKILAARKDEPAKELREDGPAEEPEEQEGPAEESKDSEPAEDYVEYPKEDDPEEIPGKLFAKVTGPVEYEPIMKQYAKGPRPLEILGMTVTGVGGKMGFYQKSMFCGKPYIQFNGEGGECLDFSISGWKTFLKELKQAAGIFGVDLDAEE